jgi:hypothetical protein
MAWVATAVIGAGVLGAGATAYSASKAADAQTAAADKASQIAQDQYQQNRADFAPYRDAGASALNTLNGRLSELTSPIVMDQATLEQTPGYQFNLTQGQKAVTNSAAARGLGTSGAALKGAATFATGLADSTYQQQFSNANTNQTNAYNRLKGLVDTGAGAANNTAASGTTASLASATAATSAGNAQAAADNRIGSSISNLTSNIGGYAAYKGLYGGSGGSGSGGYGSPAVANYNSGNAIY